MLMAAVAAVGFWWVYQGSQENVPAARTMAFCILAFSQLLFSLACRSDHFTLPQLGLLTNRYLLAAIAGSALLQFAVVMLPFTQHVFEVVTPTWPQWGVILLLSLVPVSVVEIGKIVVAAMRRTSPPG
jgi:Ca2+-transporting ATPase